MSLIKFEIEITINASPRMLYQYFSTASGLQDWFADEVNTRGKIITFVWEGEGEEAKVVTKKPGERIRFKWLDSDGDESYFEFKIQVDSITKDVSIIITDFAENDEAVEEAKRLWESQIDELKHTIGA